MQTGQTPRQSDPIFKYGIWGVVIGAIYLIALSVFFLLKGKAIEESIIAIIVMLAILITIGLYRWGNDP